MEKKSVFVPVLIIIATLLFSGCATIDPKKLNMPKQLTCLDVTSPMVYPKEAGYFTEQTTLAPGPYWSEKQDAGGIFYRAPVGGVKTLNGSTVSTRDGGIYVPFDKTKPLRRYQYFHVNNIPPIETPDNVNCENFAKTMLDTKSLPVDENTDVNGMVYRSTVGAAAAGAISGVIIAKASGVKFDNRTAGAGVAGAIVGGIIIGAIINADLGKIVHFPKINDADFNQEFRALSENVTVLSELQTNNIVTTRKELAKAKALAKKTKDCKRSRFKNSDFCKNLREERKKQASEKENS